MTLMGFRTATVTKWIFSMISEVESVVCFFLVTSFEADCPACSVDLICGNNRFRLPLSGRRFRGRVWFWGWPCSVLSFESTGFSQYRYVLTKRKPETVLNDTFRVFLNLKWRRERDSNPRWDFSHAGLANLCFRPLSHLSAQCMP